MCKTNQSIQSLSVSEIIEEHFVIPCYQRPYRWTRDHADRLWNDLLIYYSDEGFRYSLGTIVCIKKGDEYEVLDGQQRLRTLELLLRAFDEESDKFVKIESLTDKQSREYQESLDHQNEVLNYFNDAIQKAKDKNLNLGNIKNFLYQKVRIDLIALPIRQFDNNSSIVEASKMFEIINARGLPLTSLDILKADLVALYKDDKQKDSFARRWEACQKALVSGAKEALVKQQGESKTMAYQPKSFLEIVNQGAAKAIDRSASQKDNDDAPHSTKKAPIDFTNLLVIAREIYRHKFKESLCEEIRTPMALTSSEFLTRFRELYNGKMQWGSKEIDDFMGILEDCVIFIVDHCPYRNDSGEWEDNDSLGSDFRTLAQSFMAANGYANVGQYWLFLLLLVYQKGKKEKGELTRLLKQWAWESCRTDLKDSYSQRVIEFVNKPSVLFVFKNDKNDDVRSGDDCEYNRWKYGQMSRWPFYLTDWLLLKDEKNQLRVFKDCFNKPFNDKNLGDLICEFQNRIPNFKVVARGSVEHWTPQTPTSSCELDEEKINSFTNLALLESGFNSGLSNSNTKVKAEKVLKLENPSLKLLWMALFSREFETNFTTEEGFKYLKSGWIQFLSKASQRYLIEN